jgi:uncharacterized UPF0146 family protein
MKMAVVLVARIKHYIGESFDVKPTDCPAGSTFHESETKNDCLFDGSAWYYETVKVVWAIRPAAPLKITEVIQIAIS